MKSKIDLSVVIVNYKVKKELLDCVESITKFKPKLNYEIIVVDNDGTSKLGNIFKKKFPNVKYIKSLNNVGYGGGNNLGSHSAQGEYLFFLNPDTKVLNGTLDNLHNFFIKNDNVGIASPVFLDDNLIPFKSQGSKELTPKTILYSQSFLRKIFPSKDIYNINPSTDWNIKSPLSVNAIPGGAMMISLSLFRKIGGFDEKFFLYFEENDISKRIGNLGYKLFIIPSAQIIHYVGRSTKKLKNMEDIYAKSRYYYLKKHYGLFKAIFTQAILSINKNFIFLLLILVTAFFLRIINIQQTMPFIGDQGWFYLSARDMVLGRGISLVGIASSHPWLHQGPLWTYVVAFLFWISKFNPLSPAYFTIILGVLTAFLIYKFGFSMFSRRIGLIAALLYSTSPLIILNDRMPYHTTMIPFFTLLFFYSVYKWLKDNVCFFPIAILLLAVLYNFEIATSLLWIPFFLLLAYGYFKKTDWVKKILNFKIFSWSVVGLIVPLIPMLLYDMRNGFPQTVGFIVWVFYRIAMFFGFPNIHGNLQSENSVSFISFLVSHLQRLIFLPNFLFSSVLLIGSFASVIYLAYLQYKIRKNSSAYVIVLLFLTVSAIGYAGIKVASDAYFPMFFPFVISILAVGFDFILQQKKLYLFGILIIFLTMFLNIYFLLQQNYLISKIYGSAFSDKVSIAKSIVQKSQGREYNLLGKGPGSQFESFTMNYEYLTWWLGNGPSRTPQNLKFLIIDNSEGVSLREIKN